MKSEENVLSLKLKMYRQQNEMTQEDLAELLEVSDKSISKWELGKGYPSKKKHGENLRGSSSSFRSPND